MFFLRQISRIIARRLLKSAVVLLVSLVLVLFINIYTNTISQHQDTLAELHASLEVTGHIISLDGKTNDLLISERRITTLEESGFIGKALYTRNMRFMLEP